MAKKVKCGLCEKLIDKEKDPFTMIGNRYVHQECKDEKDRQKALAEKKRVIKQKIFERAQYYLGASYSKKRVEKQIRDFLQEGKTEMGILKTIEYWFGVRQEDPLKAHGGIGIVAYVYGEAQDYYWKEKTRKNKNKSINNKEIDEIIEKREIRRISNVKTPIQKPKRVNYFMLD